MRGGTGDAAADGSGPDGDGGMASGFWFIWGEPVLRTMMLALGFSVLAVGFNESACFSVVTVGLHHSASFLGVLATAQGAGAVLGGMAAAGFTGPWLSVAGVTAFQQRTPTATMGRVFGVLRLVLTIPQAASIGIGAALITVVNYRVLLTVR
jgi:hypothetical protein